MRFFRRSLIALGVAATLPTIVFGAVGAFYFLRAERSQVETATLGRSFTVVTLSDAALRGDLGALNVLANSVYFESGDRRGRFLARTRDYARRLGQPATQYVRDAMRSGPQGFYRGITYEGFRNYTAFYTSAWSGWSAHVAVASKLIDTPTSWSFVVAGVAGLGSALLAGVLVMLVLRDMAERQRAEETLRQSRKMEAVGQLTGGIAHDFNNLLTAIIGNLDMIRSRTANNKRLQRLSANALGAARRGAKLTSQLLAFSRSQRMELAPVNLEQLLGGMSGLLKQSVGPSITVNIDISPAAAVVLSDANQLELALLNLAVNARDAMPAGGTVTISTHAAADLDLHALPKRRYAEIRVADTGIGMSNAVRARAMEPFFTTKQVGQGTGLGLSQVYGVIRESGGTVFMESAPGRGTTVRMILPLAQIPEALVPAAQDEDQTPTVRVAHDRETSVLVVDDDRQVRRFVADSLQSLGYRVVDMAAGAPALALLNESRFDLLIVDFAMPGMNGAEVARAARRQQPGLRVLIISGYADSTTIESVASSATLLRKPFDLTGLGTAVAQVLGD